ncbi:MAG: arylsulfatase [Planctomycetota bacterium]
MNSIVPRLLITLLCLCGSFGHVFAEETRPPNIIFVMADDMGYGDAGCYGQKEIRTPSIDRMAAEGMKFTQCYAGSTVCAPSRSVLMTGLHTGHTRVRGNFGKGGVLGLAGGKGRVPLRDDDLTVGKVLQKAGYATGGVGKWGLGEPKTAGLPCQQGFDYWFGFLNQRRAHSHYPDYLWLREGKGVEERFPLPGNRNGRKEQYSHDLFSSFAEHFVRRHRDRPFFLYVAYTVPHAKFEVPDLEPYASKDWSEKEKAYAAMITRMDRHIGSLLGVLKELRIDRRTAVFFCSDNGAANRYEGRFDSSGPLRGRKRDMYEGGLRTPMVVRWPGVVPAGVTRDFVWSFQDFFPTAVEMAGAALPSGLDGISVLPVLKGKAAKSPPRKLYWEFFERGFQQAVRWKNWKAIRPKLNAPLELYDLSMDLSESRNIAKAHPDVVRELERFLSEARTESEEWPLPAPKPTKRK